MPFANESSYCPSLHNGPTIDLKSLLVPHTMLCEQWTPLAASRAGSCTCTGMGSRDMTLQGAGKQWLSKSGVGEHVTGYVGHPTAPVHGAQPQPAGQQGPCSAGGCTVQRSPVRLAPCSLAGSTATCLHLARLWQLACLLYYSAERGRR